VRQRGWLNLCKPLCGCMLSRWGPQPTPGWSQPPETLPALTGFPRHSLHFEFVTLRVPSGQLHMVLGLAANDARIFADDGRIGCGLLWGGDLELARFSSHRDALGERCRLKLDKPTSGLSFLPVVPDVCDAMQRVCRTSASLSSSNLSTPCTGTHAEKGNKTGESAFSIFASHTDSKQGDGHKMTVEHSVVLTGMDVYRDRLSSQR